MRPRLSNLSAMLRKDLLRQARNPLGTLLILVFPLVFSGLMALSFGSQGTGVPKVRLIIEDSDEGLVSNLLRSAFSAEEAAKYFEVEVVRQGGLERLEKDEASALLRLPPNLTRDLLERNPVVLELVRNPSQSVLPEIAEQVTAILAEVLDGAVRVLDQPLRELEPTIRDDQELTAGTVASVAVAIHRLVERGGKYVFPPVIRLEASTRGKDDSASGAGSQAALIFLFILPGVAVFSLFTLGDHLMQDLLREGQLGTLRRQLSGPVDTAQVVAGKVLLTLVMACASVLFLGTVAWLAGPRWVSLGAFGLLTLTLVLAVTGTASLIYGLARTERQGATIGRTLYLIMAFGSGSFVPLDNLPAAVRAFAPYTPLYWATEGFRALLSDGAGIAALRTHVLVLLAIGLVTLGVGSVLLGRKVQRGLVA
jgi:ABC-2 type transport system permease protein